MAARNNGSKMVVAAVSLTLAAVGVGTIYLPFIADKDKIRGLDEDGGATFEQKQQYETMIRDLQAQRANDDNKPTSNSMWKRMG
jgi:hypothetical protein